LKKSEQLKVIYDEIDKKRTRHIEILLKINDTELRLLKGHLLIEEILYELIQEKMKKASVIDKARFTFAQLLALVEGLYYEDELYEPWIYAATKNLNKIRNKLAHNTEPDTINHEVQLFYDFVISNNHQSNDVIPHPLLYSLGSIYGTFAGMLGLEKKLSLLPNITASFPFKTKLLASKLIHSGEYDEF